MTEDEAKTTWCPFARVYEFGNRESAITAGVGLMPINSNCIASQCMAWRWIPLQADEAFKNAVIKAKEDIGDKSDAGVKAAKHVMANRAAYGLPTEPFDGYCGLAGKP